MTGRSDRGTGERGRSEAAASRMRWAAAAAVAGGAAWVAPAAEAYIGPGAGMGVLGVLLAVVAAVFMALVGMVLWPIRMVAHRRKVKARDGAGDRSGANDEATRQAAQEQTPR